MNKIGLHVGYWWGTGVKDDASVYLDLSHQAELDTIEITPTLLLAMSAAERADFAAKLKDYGMTATLNGGLGPANDISSDSKEARAEGIAYCQSVLKLMPELDLTVWSGSNYSAWLRAPQAEGDAQEEKKRAQDLCLESLKEILPMAEDLGVDYAFEVLNRFEQFLFNTSEEAVAFCERTGSPRAKILLDTYHMNIEEDDTADAIAYAAKRGRLGHIHVGESNRRIPGVGKSDYDWKRFGKALTDNGYEGVIIMEPFVLTSAHNCKRIRVWRDLAKSNALEDLVNDAKIGANFLRGIL